MRHDCYAPADKMLDAREAHEKSSRQREYEEITRAQYASPRRLSMIVRNRLYPSGPAAGPFPQFIFRS